MLRQRLYTFLLALLLQPVVGAADSQSYLQPGLGVGLGKKESAQGLLEHRPVKDVSCKRFVRMIPSSNCSPLMHHALFNPQVQ